MLRTLAICVALTLVCAAAYAALPATTQVILYDFTKNGNGTDRVAGELWAQAGNGYWGTIGNTAGATVYSDGGNLCGKFNVITTGSGWNEVFFNGGLANAMKTYDINVFSFRTRYLGGLWDRWDRAIVANWCNDPNKNGGEWAYGGSMGGGFNLCTESSAGKAMGCLGDGAENSSDPSNAHGWTTGSTTPGEDANKISIGSSWTTLATVLNRVTGEVQYYQDGVMFASRTVLKTDPDQVEFVWGNDYADPARWMQWMSVGMQAKYAGAAGSYLFDDFYLGGAMIPEPGSLLALGVFGIGLIGYVRRRRA
jgi:hypothetical protein